MHRMYKTTNAYDGAKSNLSKRKHGKNTPTTIPAGHEWGGCVKPIVPLPLPLGSKWVNDSHKDFLKIYILKTGAKSTLSRHKHGKNTPTTIPAGPGRGGCVKSIVLLLLPLGSKWVNELHKTSNSTDANEVQRSTLTRERTYHQWIVIAKVCIM